MHPFLRMVLLGSIGLCSQATLAQVMITSGVLDELETTNAEQFRRVDGIIRSASEDGCAAAAKVAAARFDVQNARCDPPQLLRTSDPPKTRLTFSVGGTSYVYFIPAGGMMRKKLPTQLEPRRKDDGE